MRKSILIGLAIAAGVTGFGVSSAQAQEIPRAASTPNTPKNWVGPATKIKAQAIIDRLIANHPEIMSITMHAQPEGLSGDAYTMIAGSFPDRIGNTSSPGDIITAKKGVTQVESKWGTPDYGKKVSVVLPIKNAKGDYIPVAMVIAFHHSPASGKIDTDYMKPGLNIRNALQSEIPDLASLYAPAK